ncbi:MAG TPA: hypothetical protein DCE56_20330 [Cyanobacteria bacterium UBA8553]|nr:hypothetical protein [Cyanobacteria bacterium UBA8553]HAJ63532.1 hypothetical protein [Cyanobacteria bacterium UBA8543]
MSNSSLKKFIVTPVVISAAVFGVLSLPLALLGSKPVTIQLQGEPVFYGQLRDVATPYLGLASAISLGAGVASVAVAGWRSSTRKSSEIEAQLSDLAKHLKEKEAELEALKLSESKLEVSGLHAFADETVPLEQVIKTTSTSQKPQPVVEAPVMTSQAVEIPVAVPSNLTVQTAAAKFATSQTFLGYSQRQAASKEATPVKELAPCEVEQLHNQLQQIMAQMAYVQTALEASRSAAKSNAQVPSQSQPQVTQSWSVQSMAS